MIYLKRLWNLTVFLFSVCVLIITSISFVIEVLIITPILYILKNEIYTEKYDPFSVRLALWLQSKLMFNTKQK